ncbi:hypothetical protein GCM10011390_01410 [Aureimonas endophytica]|uniref:DUF4174 domain-containing protein n=2 Tax=Aureimonas endophytica TaxID=2027858 RepID=A0A917E060_9HYPH|nr:hypothetical protein GCM10011390_01410 [Aureimonas endophytica]
MLAALMLSTGGVSADPFGPLHWQKRLVVAFEGEPAGAVRRQEDLLPAAELRARDVVFVAVPRTGTTMVEGLGPINATSARRAYGIDPAAFTVLLIGKDGGVKRRSGSPIAAEALFSTIDAMPMRRQEMRKGS